MAAGQTNITYGNVFISNVLTRSFSQESVYDQSGVDLLYFKYTIRVVGYISNIGTFQRTGFLPLSPKVGFDGNPSAGDQAAELHHLFQTRQSFRMTVGDAVLLQANPANQLGNPDISLKDCNNGPRAKVINVDHIASNTLLRCELEFEIAQVACFPDQTTNNFSGVLNNRWSCTDDIDSDWYTTRTFIGRLRCANSMINPNSFRYLVVPPLQMGMRRESIQMRVTEDGLNLEYTVVDKEIAFSAPKPATSWSLRVTNRRDQESLFWFMDIDIMLKGDRYVDKKLLIAIASAIADAKFSNGGNVRGDGYIVMSLSISDEYSATDNSIHFSATAKLTKILPVDAVKGVQVTQLGRPVEAKDLKDPQGNVLVNNYDSRISRDGKNAEQPNIQGPIPLAGAFAAFLQTPCYPVFSISGGIQTQNSGGTVAPTPDNPDPNPGTTPNGSMNPPYPQVSATVVNELNDDGSLTNYDDTNNAHAYTYWQLDSQYSSDQLRAHCPIGTTFAGSSSGNTSVVVNLAPAMTKRVIRVVAERVGVIPTLPQPVGSFTDENGIQCVLLDNNLVATSPFRSCDNKQIFRVAGEITYALLQTPPAGATLRLGFNSWETNTPTYKMVFPEQAEA